MRYVDLRNDWSRRAEYKMLIVDAIERGIVDVAHVTNSGTIEIVIGAQRIGLRIGYVFDDE